MVSTLKDARLAPPGAQVVLINKDGEVTSGYLLLPGGLRVELSPEILGNRKQEAQKADQCTCTA